jgi:hypothetical protein
MSLENTPPSLFDACQPREDVLEGTLQEDQFAASLATVAHAPSEAAPVYRDAEQFFTMTYPTDGLKTLLSNLTGRFLTSTGHSADGFTSSILCLDTRFGGGKTHDLIAAYHLAENPTTIANLERFLIDEAEPLAADYQEAAESGVSVDTAVFVGGHVDARNARSDRSDPNAPNTRTIWGEIAYQLYGLDGYEYLKDYDQERQQPGKNTLKELFEIGDGPALILIDEIAAYLEAASAVKVADTTLADQTLGFVMSLLEAASENDEITVVYSIAETAFEQEAEDVRELVEQLNQIGRRQHKTVTPTDETEVGQVLQHRLFEDIPTEYRSLAAETYFQFYTDTNRQLPQEVTDASYVDRLERECPFHPTVIDTLTEKIDTIPKFQRTRGALKLLARAVYYLWNHQPDYYDRHYIRLYDLTPADNDPGGSINSTLRETLFDFVDLGAAVSADIYNEDGTAHAQLEDRKWTEKGIPPLGSHLTTTALWHSLAFGKQATGLTRAEFNVTLGHPDIRFDNYDSALEALSGSDMNVACYYLYDEERIRFKSDPNVIRIIDQRVDNTPDARARSRFESRLESETGTGAIHPELFPESPADLADDPSKPQLAIMHMDTAPVTDGGDNIPDKVKTLYQKKAKKHAGDVRDRVYKNYVLFLAPDAERTATAIEEARKLEAIEDLLDDQRQTADLSEEQIEDVRERRNETYGLLGEFVRGVYRHLYYVERDGLTHITINTTEANGGTSLVTAVEETLDDRLIRADADAKGTAFFKQKLWQQTQTSMTTQQLVEQFAKKPGLPYLLSTKPLRRTVTKMVNEAGYTFWDAESETAYWDGSDETDPANWTKTSPFVDSPNVRTSIQDSDVKIGDEYVVYDSIEALLDVHADEIQAPELESADCEICGVDVDAVGEPPHYCEKHDPGKPTCDNCRKEVSSQNELNAQGLCPECAGVEEWQRATSLMAASRAFNEVRTDALSEASSGGDPGVSQLTIEVGGEDQLSKASFISQQQALKDRSKSVSVRMQYERESDSGASYTATFSGSIEEFDRVTNQPEPFDDMQRTDVKFRLDLADPEPITDTEDDVLAELNSALGQTSIDLKIEARGPVQTREEVKQ